MNPELPVGIFYNIRCRRYGVDRRVVYLYEVVFYGFIFRIEFIDAQTVRFKPELLSAVDMQCSYLIAFDGFPIFHVIRFESFSFRIVDEEPVARCGDDHFLGREWGE